MGLLIAIIRKRQLRMMKSTAEWQLHLITQGIYAAQKSANDLLQVGTDYESDSLIAKKLQQRQYKLKLVEEKLNEKKSILETQIKEYTEEMQSCQSMIDAHIKDNFSYNIAA